MGHLIDDIIFCDGDIPLTEITTGIPSPLLAPDDIVFESAVVLTIPSKSGAAVEVNFVYG